MNKLGVSLILLYQALLAAQLSLGGPARLSVRREGLGGYDADAVAGGDAQTVGTVISVAAIPALGYLSDRARVPVLVWGGVKALLEAVLIMAAAHTTDAKTALCYAHLWGGALPMFGASGAYFADVIKADGLSTRPAAQLISALWVAETAGGALGSAAHAALNSRGLSAGSILTACTALQVCAVVCVAAVPETVAAGGGGSRGWSSASPVQPLVVAYRSCRGCGRVACALLCLSAVGFATAGLESFRDDYNAEWYGVAGGDYDGYSLFTKAVCLVLVLAGPVLAERADCWLLTAASALGLAASCLLYAVVRGGSWVPYAGVMTDGDAALVLWRPPLIASVVGCTSPDTQGELLAAVSALTALTSFPAPSLAARANGAGRGSADWRGAGFVVAVAPACVAAAAAMYQRRRQRAAAAAVAAAAAEPLSCDGSSPAGSPRCFAALDCPDTAHLLDGRSGGSAAASAR